MAGNCPVAPTTYLQDLRMARAYPVVEEIFSQGPLAVERYPHKGWIHLEYHLRASVDPVGQLCRGYRET